MFRASDLTSPSDFTLEHQREDIRDRRSSRYRDNAEALAHAFTKVVGSLISAVGLAHLLGWL